MYPGVEYLGFNGLEIELGFEAKEPSLYAPNRGSVSPRILDNLADECLAIYLQNLPRYNSRVRYGNDMKTSHLAPTSKKLRASRASTQWLTTREAWRPFSSKSSWTPLRKVLASHAMRYKSNSHESCVWCSMERHLTRQSLQRSHSQSVCDYAEFVPVYGRPKGTIHQNSALSQTPATWVVG